ncbi:MAG: hypothetical protein QOI75_22, partial [Pseudonocardiales bacterium]|nr:hypothetical protein [Pseudonocardiales bacterium]
MSAVSSASAVSSVSSFERSRYHHGNLRATLLESAERLLEDVGAAELSLR